MDIGVSALVAALVWAIGGRRPAPLNQVQDVLPPLIQNRPVTENPQNPKPISAGGWKSLNGSGRDGAPFHF